MNAGELFALIIALIVSWVLLKPVLVHSPVITTDEREQQLVEQKQRHLQALKDLELDFQTEKLSAEIYNSMRAELAYELGLVLEKLDGFSK